MLSSLVAVPAYNVHTVFCAECTNNFDYKSIGAFWSHNISGMPGGITRLLACDERQLKNYKGMHLGPTFVHVNHGHMQQKRQPRPGEKAGELPAGARASDMSPSYNKPGSIMHWVQESEEAKHVDYVLYIDADMLIRRPMDPVALGVKKGVVVSEHVGYLDVGLKNGLQHMFLPPEFAEYAGADVHNHGTPPPEGLQISAGGWYHFFHIDDIRQIAHRWLHYCREMRTNPQLYWRTIDPSTNQPSGADHDILTGDAYVGKGQAPWISEMYGYVFAAAEAKLRHILTEGVVVYPDDIGAGRAEEAYIIHYGLHCAVGAFRFTKYTFGNFDAVGCSGKTFGDPPRPTKMERLCSETVLTLNDAMCDYYGRPQPEGGCGLPSSGYHCPAWKPIDGSRGTGCADSNAQSCATWSHAGECKANPGFMLGSCPKSCGQCDRLANQVIPAWERGLATAKGLPPPALRQRPAGLPPVSMSTESPEEAAKEGEREDDHATRPQPRALDDRPILVGEATPAAAEPASPAAAKPAAAKPAAHLPAAAPAGAQPIGGGATEGAVSKAAVPAAVEYHGPSNEHHDSAHAMGPDGRAVDTPGSLAADATGGKRLRGKDAKGGAAPPLKPKRNLRSGGAAFELPPKPTKAAAAEAAGEHAPAAGAAQAQPGATAVAAKERPAAVAAEAAQPAEEPTAAQTLTSRMIVLWAGMLLVCVGMVGSRMGLLPGLGKRAKKGPKAAARSF